MGGPLLPAPYLAPYKWVHLDDIGRVSKNEWARLIDHAYHLVASRLPAKTRKHGFGMAGIENSFLRFFNDCIFELDLREDIQLALNKH